MYIKPTLILVHTVDVCLVKWEDIEPEQNVFDFGPADEIVKFAESVNAKVRGHNFMWYVVIDISYSSCVENLILVLRENQLPPWVNDTLTATELDRALKNHITTIMDHYRGKLYAIDVIVRISSFFLS